MINMNGAVVVLPGANAMRRLMNLLVLEAEKRSCALIPPRLMTPGSLCDFFIPSLQELAPPGSRLLAWIAALQQAPVELLRVLVNELPDEKDFKAWLSLAKRIDLLHVEASSSSLGFAEVATRGAELPSFLDEERWQALEQIAYFYRQILKSQGKVDIYFDRLERLRDGEKVSFDGSLYLAGTIELNSNIRELLTLLQGGATALIFGPENLSEHFDSVGAIVPAAWEKSPIPLAESQLSVVEAPKDVVGEIYRITNSFKETHAISDISIGIGAESEVQYIKGSLNDLGIPARSASGSEFSRTEFGALLRAMVSYLNSHAYSHFSTLIRHPVMVRALSAQNKEQGGECKDFAEISDRYQERHLQAITSAEMPTEGTIDTAVVRLVEQVNQVCVHLLGPAKEIDVWVEKITECVNDLYPFIDPMDREIVESFLTLVSDLSDAEMVMQLKGTEALLLAIQLAEESLSLPDPHVDAVELLGWLEVGHDDAPLTILTALDEGVVPAVINADPFLPNALRRHLGLTDNEKRLARDTYILSSVLHSKRSCSVIVARRNLDATPRFPSRLLLACADSELPQRISHLYQEGRTIRLVRSSVDSQKVGEISIEDPQYDGEEIKAMPVTSFRDYLECPYRFYLKHIRRAKECKSNFFEMDAPTFGNLAHAVLDKLAQEPEITHFSAEVILEAADRILDQKVRKQFGKHEFPAIRIQVEQLRERLRPFSQWQAMRNREGWKIVAVEKDISDSGCLLSWDSGEMGIRGRIDRIDYHEKSNQYTIIDYKSGDNQKSLDKVVETKRGQDPQWLDLQIPLYTHAARTLFPDASIDFIYVNLSAHGNQEIITETSELSGMIGKGIDLACEVARKVRTGAFWPPTASLRFDPYQWILGGWNEDSESHQGEDHE